MVIATMAPIPPEEIPLEPWGNADPELAGTAVPDTKADTSRSAVATTVEDDSEECGTTLGTTGLDDDRARVDVGIGTDLTTGMLGVLTIGIEGSDGTVGGALAVSSGGRTEITGFTVEWGGVD